MCPLVRAFSLPKRFTFMLYSLQEKSGRRNSTFMFFVWVFPLWLSSRLLRLKSIAEYSPIRGITIYLQCFSRLNPGDGSKRFATQSFISPLLDRYGKTLFKPVRAANNLAVVTAFTRAGALQAGFHTASGERKGRYMQQSI